LTVNTDIQPKVRLYFLDALRAFAILMMLQGHFISGLLDPSFKDSDNLGYRIWLYCRGFTAPLFFTITGWVFTFLLLRNPIQGLSNPRIGKGIKRALELLIWGYILRLNLPSLLGGKINNSFVQPDVLHIIGLGLIFVMMIYVLMYRNRNIMFMFFVAFGTLVFLTQPIYSRYVFENLPRFISGYLTKGNGGVFYLFPWLGYVSIGAAIACVFKAKRSLSKFYVLGFLILGFVLIFTSSWITNQLGYLLEFPLFNYVAKNNFLFIRLGDVFVLFGLFMLFQPLIKHRLWLQIGSKTLSLYIVHYFILYGSLSGLGLYKYFKQSLDWQMACIGAVLFVLSVSGLVLAYFNNEKQIKRAKHDFQLRLKQLLSQPLHK
jgi:uncharacterized membrane protein